MSSHSSSSVWNGVGQPKSRPSNGSLFEQIRSGLCGVQKASLLDPVFKKHPSRGVLTIDPKLLGHLVA